ncbi:cyclic pyranopterin monophosphate synthase MoaC [Flectobacillus major]|jgi:cyclic pyranopterin phosphate synthase|uniref:cyclic pyranopterin monophosphate synthase MoaC n=1 Tax=Flectobacillus major TaxID=103 RepID=UPI00041D8C7E|nr:cyclic pyranopterin monophosphate synthase MoaC [Flectobacillus major]
MTTENPVDKTFTHLDTQHNPSMVDVSEKAITKRTATARSIVVLTPEIIAQLTNGDIQTKKGAVFQTAIIAGTMGAKKTAELIPLCHPLGLDSCKFNIEVQGLEVIINCTCSLTAKTGVEMEALTGASIAALTVYDMCKAFSHDLVIKETKLMIKTGGKSDYKV